ncbi:MAG TPA: hypothetical protein VHC68_03095 [Candidatus Paceibacterota bacterium]|nr:hypothetical protein [Candidatus Paceibacterota bacterium]
METEHRLSPHLLLVASLAAVIAAAVVIDLRYFPRAAGPVPVELVGAHEAADYSFDGAALALVSPALSKIGPVGQGYALTARLQMPPPPAPGSIVIAAPQPYWDLRDGAGTDLGAGRPLAPAPGGGIYALTAAGLVSIDPSGIADPVVAGGSSDLVGALAPGGRLLALKNTQTRFVDLYALAPGGADYLGNVPLYDPAAAALPSEDRLLLLAPDKATVYLYALSSGAPQLLGTTTLPAAWP